MKKLAYAAIVAVMPFQAGALSTGGPEITDMWWNESEPGWGLNIIQQDNTSFATLFAYGPDGSPRWYVASDLRFQGFTQDGATRHEGQLFETSGPWLGVPFFNPVAVGNRPVGTMTLVARPLDASLTKFNVGTLTYTVDGTPVTKQVTRYSFRAVNHAGTYYGGMRNTITGCTNPANNGEGADLGQITVAHPSPNTIQLRYARYKDTNGANSTFSCTYTGTYLQTGRMGAIDNGTFSCSAGQRGNFIAWEVQSGVSGMTATVSLTHTDGNGCSQVIRFAGAK